jgi:hypothetical protein
MGVHAPGVARPESLQLLRNYSAAKPYHINKEQRNVRHPFAELLQQTPAFRRVAYDLLGDRIAGDMRDAPFPGRRGHG